MLNTFSAFLFFFLLTFAPSIAVAAPATSGMTQEELSSYGERKYREAEKEFENQNYGRAKQIIEEAVQALSDAKSQYASGLYELLSSIYFKDQETEKAIQAVNRSLEEAEKFYLLDEGNSDASYQYVRALTGKGTIMVMMGQTKEGFSLLDNAMKVAQRSGDAEAIIIANEAIGPLYQKRGDFKKAEEAYLNVERHLPKFEGAKAGDYYEIYRLLMRFYLETQNFEKVIKYGKLSNQVLKGEELKEAFHKNNIEAERITLIMSNYMVIGGLYGEMGEHKNSLDNLHEAQKFSDILLETPSLMSAKVRDLLFVIDAAIVESYLDLNNFEAAKLAIFTADNRAVKFNTREDALAALRRDLGIKLDNAGYAKESVAFFKKAYEYHKSQGNRDDMSTNLMSLGIVAEGSQKYEYYKKAEAIMKEDNDKISLAGLYNCIAFSYAKDGAINKARTYIDKSMSFLSSNKASYNFAAAMDTLGYIQYLEGDLEAAEASLLEAADENMRYEDKEGSLTHNHMHLGMVYVERGDRAQACQAFSKALDYNANTGNQKDKLEIKQLSSQAGCV